MRKDKRFRRYIENAYELSPIYLPKEEYAHVMSELNTNMSDEERRRPIVVKPIGNYSYVVLNRGFDEYIIVGKYLINSEDEDILEEL